MPLPSPVFPHGLVAAPFTPFQPNGELNLGIVARYADALEQKRVTAAFICGTTGEGASMTTAERQQVAAQWRADKPPSLRLIVHVGHNSTNDSRTLAAHAEQIGADAIAAIAPGFFQPATIRDLVEWCVDVAAAAPGLPFYYYHMPAMTGANFPMIDFLPRAIERIPTFAGIKFTHENLMDYSLTLAAAGESHAILFGRDEILLGALALGARGAVGSTYNYMAPIFHRVMSAFSSGNLAAAQQEQLLAQRLIAIMIKHGGLAAGKAIMGLIGLNCGPVRRPLTPLSVKQSAGLRADLDQAGFFAAIAEATAK
ncbi:MAG: dihydrodipicolinate synthase family protein [Opitutus sp.]